MVKMRAFLVLFLTFTTARADIPDDIRPENAANFAIVPVGPSPEHAFSEDVFSIPREPDRSKWRILNTSYKNINILFNLKRLIQFMDDTLDLNNVGFIDIPGFTFGNISCPSGRLSINKIQSYGEVFVLIRNGLRTIWTYSEVGTLTYMYPDCSHGVNNSVPVTGDVPDTLRIYWQVTVKRGGRICLGKIEKFELLKFRDLRLGKSIEVTNLERLTDYITRLLVPGYILKVKSIINERLKDFTEKSTRFEHMDDLCDVLNI